MLSKTTLQSLSTLSSPAPLASFSNFLSRGEEFEKMIRRRRPTKDNWMKAMKKRGSSKETLLEVIKGTYPVVHERVLVAMQEFLDFKKKEGTGKEREVYAEMDVIGLADRLLSKRPLAFLNACDGYTLRNGQHGANDWDLVGTDKQKSQVTAKDYMTYDEIKLAALIQASSAIMPINTGSRHNVGRVGDGGEHVKDAVYVGAVGARFERKDPEARMEWQEILVTSEQNTLANGYGQDAPPNLKSIFARLYGLPSLPSYEECKEKDSEDMTKLRRDILFKSDLEKLNRDVWFNCDVYRQRIEISAETFLLEAEARGREFGKSIYAHVVGLGLGVWMHDADTQKRVYLEAFQNVIQRNKFEKLRVIDFSWIAKAPFPGSKFDVSDDFFPGTNIQIRFSRRDPFAQLPETHQDKLVVAMYAWDGNAFPGNEYWNEFLSASGDPAAACCSQIPELQNPYINTEHMCGANLRVVSTKYGLLHVSEYAKKMLQDMEQ